LRTSRFSRDKNFATKVADVVGLYLDPPDKALVLCVGEKSQIQALDRTQPGLPMKKGRAGTMTYDYKRNGTTTLFAALNMLDGKVIGTCMARQTPIDTRGLAVGECKCALALDRLEKIVSLLRFVLAGREMLWGILDWILLVEL
jgi:hypothetical protein